MHVGAPFQNIVGILSGQLMHVSSDVNVRWNGQAETGQR